MAKTVKKKNRKLRRQVRKTVGALLMVSAITVAAIPVPENLAQPSDYGTPPTKWVKCLNFTSNISTGSGTWENCPGGGAAITEWESSVPLVDVDITKYPIYTTSTTNNTVPYRFAFVPSEPASGTNVAVILGTEKQKISNNTLTIDSVVDAYKKYSYNTSATNYCAVSMDDSFLFYPTKFQRKDGLTGFWKVVNNEYPPEGRDSTYGDIPDGYARYITLHPEEKKTNGAVANASDNSDYLKKDEIMKTDNSVEPAVRSLDVTITTYVVEEYEDEEDDGTGTLVKVTKYRWKENVEHNIYQLEMSMVDGMQPCFDSTEDVWSILGDGGLYYYTATGTPDLTDVGKFASCNSIAEKQRIHDVEVWYIGQQYVVSTEEGVWEIAGEVDGSDPYKGIFSDLKNVVNLNLPSTLQGIGDYAFYGSQIKNVKFHDDGRIKTIGNYSFANCVSLSNVDIPLYSQVTVIGEGAFWNDYSLASFTAPTSLCAIGDFAFSDCTGLQMVDLTSQGNANYLNAIGFHAFENCTGLTSIEFPEKFKQDSAGLPATIKNKVPINSFKGCININHFTFNNNALDIADGLDPDEAEDTNHAYRSDGNDATDCDIDKFVAALNDPDGFYLEGIASEYWPVYKTAKDHRIAYKHLGEEIYERWVECSESPQHVNTFIVNAAGDITAMTLETGCTEVVIPERIGKIGIKKLTGTSFTDNCSLKKVYIPQSIEMIESGAFKGCHNLETVIFTRPENPNLIIENGAFATQNVGVHKTGCTTPLKPTPYLLFVGTVSDAAAPFQYAMDPANNINVGSQTANSYIYFSSGWPTNLLVKYDADTDKNTLIDYPRYNEISTIGNKTVTVGTETYQYPKAYLTNENISAAATAKGSYENWVNRVPGAIAPTGDELGIVNAALNIVLPSGIEAIQTGLFSGLETDGAVLTGAKPADTDVESIMTYTVEDIEPYAFAGCTKLTGFSQNPTGGMAIEEYAFRNCSSLENVSIAASVTDLGVRPFMGCDKVSYVDFNDSPYFECRDAIIYGKDSGGTRSKIIECLECRGTSFGNAKVGPEELEGVKEMEKEAFMDCDGIGQVDLTSSSLKSVPAMAFALTDQLGSVKLPETCTKIEKGAFWDSSLYYIEVPASVTLVNPEAFADVDTEDKYKDVQCQPNQYIKYQANGDPQYEHQGSGHKIITASCVEDSAMDTYASDYYYINPEYFVPTIYHTVYFWDTYISKSNPDLIESQKVIDGEDAVPPAFPEHDGVVPSAWTPNYKGIVRDTDVTTVYSGEMHKVWFQYTDMSNPDNPKVVKLTEEQWVEHGKSATPPSQNPYNDGYVFTGWTPDYRNIYDDGPIIAVFKSSSPDDRHTVTFYDHEGNLVASYKVDDGGSVVAPAGPARAGYTFVGWAPNKFTDIQSDIVAVASYEKIVPTPAPGGGGSGGGGGSSPKPGSTATPTPASNSNSEDSVKKYTVSVSGGSGSGSYPAGAVVAINAYDMGVGQNFDKWTSSTAGVGFANPNASSTTFTMPAANVSVTATYKTGSGSSNSGGSTGGSGSTGAKSKANNGTTVQVTKPGISNTNLAGATVSGATDNFIVKVTEDDAAARAVTAALQARYGDLSRIKYLPMDISLYDSEGRTKIADTSGISVNLTLPLPDDLIQYAGNNKVAAIAGGALEDLNTRFTTVDGVPCVNFTATHFSPYVIYVDTANLTQATIDSTPKTGDPIHPKWFLAIGLACISLILFFKRDKVAVKPA